MSLDHEWLQSLLDEVAGRLGVVGGQLAIYDGAELAEFATGAANLKTGIEVTPDTLFQIGSTTKPYTAALVMQLVDEGKLDLDAPVKRTLPELKLADAEATERVSCRHLLSMTSGIDNGPYSDHGRGDDCVERYVASLAEIPQIFPPGDGYGYSNASTVVAGRVVEKLTGQSWDDALRDRLLRPAGLEYSASLPEELIFHRVAVGHLVFEGRDPVVFRRWGLGRCQGPAGASLCASAGDLVRFGQIFLQGGEAPSGTRVLSRDAVEQMHTPQVELPTQLMAHRWGIGPYWKRWDGRVIHGHSGTNTGGSSTLLWVPERNAAIATVSNVPNQGYPLADELFARVFPEVLGIARPEAPVPDPTLEFDAERAVGTSRSWGIRTAAPHTWSRAPSPPGASRSADDPSSMTSSAAEEKEPMRFSACHWCLTLAGEPSDAQAYFRGIKATGCDGVEMIPSRLFDAAHAADLEIVNLTGHAIERGMNRREHHAEIIEGLQRCIEQAAAAHVAEIIVFSGNRRDQPDDEGIENCVRCVREILPAAEAGGVALTLEALNSHDHADYQADHPDYAFSVARQIDSPSLRVLYDIYHMERMGADVARDLTDNLDLISHLHVAGVPGRGFPGPDKSPDYASLVRAVSERGYTGRWGMEFLPESPDTGMGELAEAVKLFRSYADGTDGARD